MHSLLSGQHRSHTRAIDLPYIIYVKRNYQDTSEVTLRHLSGLSSAASICIMYYGWSWFGAMGHPARRYSGLKNGSAVPQSHAKPLILPITNPIKSLKRQKSLGAYHSALTRLEDSIPSAIRRPPHIRFSTRSFRCCIAEGSAF